MEQFDFTTPIDRRNSLSVKWDKEAIASICNNGEAKPFWVADMDFKAPPAVLEALQDQITHGVLGYPRLATLQETIAAWTKKRHQWHVDPKFMASSPGMLASIATLIELYSQKGEGIVVPMPAYKPFVTIIKGLGRTLIPWPMHYDAKQAHFSLDFTSLRKLLEIPQNPLLLFCSPHNPSGRVFTEKELSAIAEIAAKFDTTIVSDEIHADLAFPTATHIPFGTIADHYGITCATCIAPSKTFNIAGEHFSTVVCSTQAMKIQFSKRMRALHSSPDILASVTALAAYKGGYEWLMQLNKFLAKQAHRVAFRLQESNTGLTFITPEASFIGLIDCSAIYSRVEKDAERNPDLYQSSTSVEGGLLSRFFGQRAGIAMNDGTWFGQDYFHFVRLNYGTSPQALEDALTSIIEAVKALN